MLGAETSGICTGTQCADRAERRVAHRAAAVRGSVAIRSSQPKSPSIALPDMQIPRALPSLRKASRMAVYYADVERLSYQRYCRQKSSDRRSDAAATSRATTVAV